MNGAGTWLSGGAERLLNLALELDAETADGLRTLADTPVDLHIPELGIAWRLQAELPGRIRITPAGEAAALVVSARLADLAAALGAGGGAIDRLEVRGDVELLKRLEHLVRGYRPDVEGRLAGLIGEPAARQACRAGRETGTLTVRVARKFVADLGEYLRERELAPDGKEVRGFIDAVDQLRDRVEHLAERVRTLERRASD